MHPHRARVSDGLVFAKCKHFSHKVHALCLLFHIFICSVEHVGLGLGPVTAGLDYKTALLISCRVDVSF